MSENKFEPINPSPEEKLEQFRQEIGLLKAQELEKKEKGEQYNPHFEIIEPSVLNDRDQEIYEKYKGGTLEREEFESWRNDINREKRTERPDVDSMKDPRSNFYFWLGNQLSTKEWMERWNEK